MVIVIAQARIRADALEATFQAAREMVARTRGEPGCIAYGAHQSLSDPQSIVFVERWESQAHVDTHMALPHTQAFLGLVGGVVESAPTIEMFPVAS